MRVAAIQIHATADKPENLKKAARFICTAASRGAKFIVLPELFHYRGISKLPPLQVNKIAESIPGETTRFLSSLAKRLNVFILGGSVLERAGKGKAFNTSILINNKGKLVARYRKINLFRANLKGKVLDELMRFKAGSAIMTANLNGFTVGLSICYDLRFPLLYQTLARRRVDIICVPSNFTKPTGEAHWETLLRARAIETLSYVIAPNQVGGEPGSVPSYGNSMIIDPWGKVLFRASSSKEEIIYAQLDKKHIIAARNKLPLIRE